MNAVRVAVAPDRSRPQWLPIGSCMSNQSFADLGVSNRWSCARGARHHQTIRCSARTRRLRHPRRHGVLTGSPSGQGTLAFSIRWSTRIRPTARGRPRSSRSHARARLWIVRGSARSKTPPMRCGSPRSGGVGCPSEARRTPARCRILVAPLPGAWRTANLPRVRPAPGPVARLDEPTGCSTWASRRGRSS